MRFLQIIIITLVICIDLSAQSLRLEDIMKGNEFIGQQPDNHRWTYDGSMVFFDWNPNDEQGSSKYYWKDGMLKPELATLEMQRMFDVPFMANH
ncbi:MAG: hypothetical protein WAU01_06560 [Saprospiraceae bacterium]